MIAKRDEVADSLADLVLDGGATDSTDVAPVAEDAALQALAFTVWAFEAGRDIKAVQEIVSERTGITVPLHQLREWRRVGEWQGISGNIHQTLVNSTTITTRATLQMATVKAATGLLRVLNDPNATNKEIISAASTILDRTGFPVMVRGEMFNGLDIGVSDTDDDQLEAQWLDYSPDPIAERHGDTSRIDTIREGEYHATRHGAYTSY